MAHYGNRGMTLEALVELTCKSYAVKGIANIQKIATPVKVLKTYPDGHIYGYWDKKSTVDFVGTVKDGRYVCFDAKETTTGNLPLKNIKDHQLKHLKNTYHLGGMAFLVIWFREKEKCYALGYEYIEKFMNEETRKSIPISYCEKYGKEIEIGTNYAIDFLNVGGKKYE